MAVVEPFLFADFLKLNVGLMPLKECGTSIKDVFSKNMLKLYGVRIGYSMDFCRVPNRSQRGSEKKTQ